MRHGGLPYAATDAALALSPTTTQRATVVDSAKRAQGERRALQPAAAVTGSDTGRRRQAASSASAVTDSNKTGGAGTALMTTSAAGWLRAELFGTMSKPVPPALPKGV